MTTHTFDTSTSGDAHRPPAAVRFLHSFRHWRKGRPFPAGLLIILAGVELWLAPLSSIGTIMHEGIGGISAFFIGMLMVMFGLTVWVAPAYRFFAGIASILLGLVALPATNLGGFFIGTLLALIGGGLATSWTARPGWEAPTFTERRRMRAAQAAAVRADTEQSETNTAQSEVNTAQSETAQSDIAHSETVPTADLPEVENTGAAERPEV